VRIWNHQPARDIKARWKLISRLWNSAVRYATRHITGTGRLSLDCGIVDAETGDADGFASPASVSSTINHHYRDIVPHLPSPQLDNIRAMTIVWRIGGKTVSTVLGCIVYYNSADKWAVLTVNCWLRFSFGFCTFLPLCSCVVCFCCVRFRFFSTKPGDWPGRTSPRRPILWWVGIKSQLNNSITLLPRTT